MRTLATESNWPPTHLDEIADLLTNVPYPYFRRAQQRDSEYGLAIALAELGDSLALEPGDQKNEGDRWSLVADATGALEKLGPSVCARITTIVDVLPSLKAYAATGDDVTRDRAAQLVVQLQSDLTESETAVAAFDDLLMIAQDSNASHIEVKAKLDVLSDVLELGDRSAAEVCRILGGVVDDQALEISGARHEVHGTPVEDFERVDELAGLGEDVRLDLCRQYLRLPAAPARHIVWLAYGDAKIGPGDWRGRLEDWRVRVGPVEFFDGPTLVQAIRELADGSPDGSVPEELRQLLDRRGRDGDYWPDAAKTVHWVAVRVDLGVASLPNAIATGRAQAEAVVQLAIFEREGSTWFPLEGVLHFADGRHRSSERFHVSDGFHDLRVEKDTTARELAKVAAAVGTRLPVVDPALKRFLREVRALNTSSGSADPEMLTNDFRVIEFVTRRNSHGDWAGFLKDNLAAFRARNEILHEIYESVSAVLRAFHHLDGQELEDQIRKPLADGMVLMNRKAALDLIPRLEPGLPIYHHAARRLREVARRTQDLTHLREWVDELAADYKIKIARAARLRNGLVHGGVASLDAAETIRLLIRHEARVVARSTLEAILNGSPVKPAFDGYRTRNRQWKRRILAAEDVTDALFDEKKD